MLTLLESPALDFPHAIVSVTLPSTGYVFIKQARKSLRGHGCNFLLTIKVFPMFQV
jgi:hypothetical protein